VKIVWTLRADPVGESESMFHTETRVTTTDQAARTKFRWYWARFSPGIVLIRRVMLGLLKTDAERRARRAETPLRGCGKVQTPLRHRREPSIERVPDPEAKSAT
jgi:hypothetical protein